MDRHDMTASGERTLAQWNDMSLLAGLTAQRLARPKAHGSEKEQLLGISRGGAGLR
jgi:hypothetical protein